MARGNDIVQQRLFDRLDLLLNIQGAEANLADALTEVRNHVTTILYLYVNQQVFTGNKTTCLKILPHHIQKIMQLSSVHGAKAPQFLDLLNAVVKVS